MITRDEAKARLDLARSGRFGQHRRAEMLKVIDEIYNGIEEKLRSEYRRGFRDRHTCSDLEARDEN